MIKRNLFLLILIGLLTACNRQAEKTIPSNSSAGIEVIVYTWDWPMMANIPPIHIWKDNRAIWLDWDTGDQEHHWQVYETYLSRDEVLKIQETLRNSGFWEDEQQEAKFTNASNFVIWASFSGREKSVGVNKTNYETTVSSLREILEASSKKVEYFPNGGYLFAKPEKAYSGGYSERDYFWPDEKVMFEFSQASQGVYVDGKVLLTIWDAIQQGDFRIISHNKTYYYDLKIPDVSCVISNDPDDPYLCNLYTAEVR